MEKNLLNDLKKINISHNKMGYRIVKDFIEGNYNRNIINGVVHPCRYTGKCRFTRVLNYKDDIIYILEKLNIKYKSYNVAERMGKVGERIEIIL